MLPIIPPLPVPHYKQQQASDCLAAPRRNIQRLARLGFDVIYREASLSIMADYLQAGHPIIAFVDTAELAYWTQPTNHAVVVIGLDAEDVILNDPAFASAPVRVSHAEFDLAWLYNDNVCAIVRPMRE